MPSTDGGPCYSEAQVEKGRVALRLLAKLCAFLEEEREGDLRQLPDTVQEWWSAHKREEKELKEYHRKVRLQQAQDLQEQARRLAANAERLLRQEE